MEFRHGLPPLEGAGFDRASALSILLVLMAGSGHDEKGYMPMSQVLSAPRASDATGRIPLLDIGPYLAGEPGARADLGALRVDIGRPE